MDEARFIIILFLVVTANVLWYWLKFDLRKHGYKTSILTGHFADLANARQVIITNKDKSVANVYSAVLGFLTLTVIAFVIAVFYSFSSLTADRCDGFDSYLSHSYSDRLKEKFIDSDNHSVETLILLGNSKESTIYMNLNQRLYQFVEPGDFITKRFNDSTILVTRGDETFQYLLRRRDFCR